MPKPGRYRATGPISRFVTRRLKCASQRRNAIPTSTHTAICRGTGIQAHRARAGTSYPPESEGGPLGPTRPHRTDGPRSNGAPAFNRVTGCRPCIGRHRVEKDTVDAAYARVESLGFEASRRRCAGVRPRSLRIRGRRGRSARYRRSRSGRWALSTASIVFMGAVLAMHVVLLGRAKAKLGL
jgi:hypothetical protein